MFSPSSLHDEGEKDAGKEGGPDGDETVVPFNHQSSLTYPLSGHMLDRIPDKPEFYYAPLYRFLRRPDSQD